MKQHTPQIDGAGDFCARSSWSPMKSSMEPGGDVEAAFEAELFAALLSSDNERADAR